MILAAVGTTVATDFDYRPAASLPVTGTLAPDASEVYSRLPDSLKGKVRDELWALGLNPPAWPCVSAATLRRWPCAGILAISST